ncbi:MAG: serine/threonine-protein kinase [Planctomycetota bacterium]
MATPDFNKTGEFQTEGQVERLAAEFLAEMEAGGKPELSDFCKRLDSDDEWQHLQHLISTAQGLDQEFPFRLKPGLVLAGRYRLEEVLGTGGMGQVWRAHDSRLDGPVALKVLTPAGANTMDAEARFQTESQTLARLQHPNIVAVHDTGADEDIRFLVMDLVDGKPLDKIINDLRRQPRDATALRKAIGRELPPGIEDLLGDGTADSWYGAVARIMVEILRTLEAAHGAGVLHRDIKPGNLMLRGGGHPMLLDFGLCGSLGGGAGEVSQGLFGTAVYLAPEQVMTGRVGSSACSDIYQLGAVFYEFLTLRRAIEGEDTGRVLNDIVKGRFEEPCKVDPMIPAELEDICLKAMELVSHRRYASAREFREDLERFLGGTEVPHACRHRWARSARYFGRRNRLGLMVAGAASIGLALGAMFMLEEPDAVVWQASISVGTRKGVEVELRREQVVYVMRWFEDTKGERLYIPARLIPHKTSAATPPEMVDNGLLLPAGTHEVLFEPPPPGLSKNATTKEQLFNADKDAGQRRKLKHIWRDMWTLIKNQGIPAVPKRQVRQLIAQLNETARAVGTQKEPGYVELDENRFFFEGDWRQAGVGARTIKPRRER